VLFLILIWEGTCIGFFIDLLLQCQVPRTTPCLLSHLIHPISRHLIYAHEFKFFIKTSSIFENFELFSFLAPRPEYPPPWAEYPGGPDYPPPGRIIRPECRPGINGGRVGLPPGSSNPNPLVFPAAASPPELRPSPWPDLTGGCSPPSWESFHQAVFAMDAGIFLTLGLFFTYAYSWCLALSLINSCHHESCSMLFSPDLSI
jgi:hypothetical protein